MAIEIKTFLQHQIEMTVTHNMGYNNVYFKNKMKGRELAFEDHTDVQFNLVFTSLRSASLQGRERKARELFPQAWELVSLRQRLAESEPAIFLYSAEAVDYATKKIHHSRKTASPLYDYSLKRMILSLPPQSTNRDELTEEELSSLQISETTKKSLLTDVPAETIRKFDLQKLIDGYLDAIFVEAPYRSAF